MFRILVFSDTHGRPQYAKKAIENIGEYNMIVHMGDLVRDAQYLEDWFPDAEHITVRGNNDIFSSEPAEAIIEREGIRIFVTHGHLYSVKSGFDKIISTARQNNCSVILFGHTHITVCKELDGVLLMNPGGYNSYPMPHCGVIELDNGKAFGCLYAVKS